MPALAAPAPAAPAATMPAGPRVLALPARLALAAPVRLALVALAFLVVFQGRLADYGWTLAATVVAWGAARIGAEALGPVAGAGLAALVLGALCNVYARRARRPGATLLLPSLMLILPGSLGFRSLTLMLHQQTLDGLQAGVQSLIVTVALMLGLLLANATVSRRSF